MDVLIVSQDQIIRPEMKSIISRCGHNWKEVTSAVLAPFVIKEMGHSFDLLIIAGALNGTDSLQLVKNLREHGIQTPAYIVEEDGPSDYEKTDQELGICIRTFDWLRGEGLIDLLDHLSGKPKDIKARI